jgi:hypothetical protein
MRVHTSVSLVNTATKYLRHLLQVANNAKRATIAPGFLHATLVPPVLLASMALNLLRGPRIVVRLAKDARRVK